MFTAEHGYTDAKITYTKIVGKYKINCTLFAGSRFESVGSTKFYGNKKFYELQYVDNIKSLMLANF